MKRYVVGLFMMLMLIVPVKAQSDCGNGVPCGAVPWRMPALPNLASPTPMPTLELPDTSISPGQPTNTPLPPPTATLVNVDTLEIEGQLATLNAVVQSTPHPVYIDAESTEEVDLETTFTELGGNAGVFFGYARGLSGETFGPLAPLISLTLVGMAVVISVKSLTFLLPIIAALFGIVRKIVNTILEFLPL